MPKELHDKVNELLKNDSFYPEKSEKEREDLAWPIATNILKESSFNFKNYRLAQVVNEESFKSKTLNEFATKFFNYAQSSKLRFNMAYDEYAKRATYNDNKLSGYKGFKLFQNYLNRNAIKPLTILDLTNELTNLEKDQSNFVFDEATSQDTDNAQTANTQTSTTTPANSQDITGDSVLSGLPGAQKIPGNSGATNIQNIIQYNSQSAARAPKTEAQIKASEGMFMSDNMDALRILSTNVSDRNALKNFEKNLIFSKNHIGTRFEAPVNNLMNLYAASLNLKAGDVREKNKIGAQIQAIINNQLLGSGVKPSVIFDQVNPRQLTDYLYSKPGTNYAFRYLEDVYFQDKAKMETEFETARKAFRDKYLTDLKEKNPDTPAERLKFDTLDESLYPDNLKKVAGPGSPIHKREWMEANKKSIMQELANQPTKDSSLKATEGPAINAPVGDPNKTKPPTNPAPPTNSAPPSGGNKTTANRINKFNLFKHS